MLYYIIGGILLLILLYFIALMPRMLRRPNREFLKENYYAHRGVHNNNSQAPENSMKAFSIAMEKGMGIELDVQLTKDKVPVVFHDYTLKRMCKVDKKISDCTYEEIQNYLLFSSDQRIPKLKEVLELINGKVPLIIELKVEWDAVMTCKKVSDLLQYYKGEYGIESFSPLALIWFRKNHPSIVRGQLSTNFIREKEKGDKKVYFMLHNLLLNFLTKPDFIAYDYKYKNNLSFIITTKIYGALAIAWTIQSQKTLNENKDSFISYIFDSFIPDSYDN